MFGICRAPDEHAVQHASALVALQALLATDKLHGSSSHAMASAYNKLVAAIHVMESEQPEL